MTRRANWKISTFDPAAEYVVSHKGLLFGGRRFELGDPFDVSTTERQLRILFEGKFLEKKAAEPEPYTSAPAAIEPPRTPGEGDAVPTPGGPEEPAPDEPADTGEAAPEQEGPGEQDPADDPPESADSDEPTAEGERTIEDLGRGWYNVLEGGARINEKKLRLDDAQALQRGDEGA